VNKGGTVPFVREGAGVAYTVDRILKANYSLPSRDSRRPDTKEGAERWHGYVPQFREAMHEELRNQFLLMSNLWKGIPIKQTRSNVWRLKQKACFPRENAMDSLDPRTPPLPATECGKCVELMRDLAIDWHRSAKRDRVGVSMSIDRVCEDIDLRHPVERRGELSEYCEETVNDPEFLNENGVTASLLSFQSLRDSPLQMAGVLSHHVCVAKASACTKRQLGEAASLIAKVVPMEANSMFVGGMMSTGEDRDDEDDVSHRRRNPEHEKAQKWKLKEVLRLREKKKQQKKEL